MTDDLSRLVYVSRNLIAEDVEGVVREILAASRRNNPHVGVTGALMFNRHTFAQVLEGDRKAVEQTFERIQRDDRHADVIILDLKRVEDRGFPQWSMAYMGQSESDAGVFGDIGAGSGFDPAKLSGERVFDAMSRLLAQSEKKSAA